MSTSKSSSATASYKVMAIVSPGQELEVQTRSLQAAMESLPPDGVLVRVAAAGVCHTDLHLWQGGYRTGKDSWLRFADRAGYGYPIVPGHEIAGSVHALGSRLPPQSLAVGDRVVVYTFSGCDECHVCRGGDPHLCALGKKQLGFTVDGGYAEYVGVSHWKYAVKFPGSVSYQQGCLLSCGGLTAYSSIKSAQAMLVEKVRRWKVKLCVGIIGLGGLGQWALRLLPHCIPGMEMKVVGIDISENKIKMVQEEGLVEGTFLFNSAGDRSEEASRFSDLFHGEKLHMILDSVNSEHTCLFAMNVLHKGGVLISLGLHGGSCELALPMLPLNAYTIYGAHGGSLSELEELIELVERHSTIQMQVREYPFSDANNALCDLMSGLIPGRGVLVL